MKTGIELITKERNEQIEKHKWNENHDNCHIQEELVDCAMYAMTGNPAHYPVGWDKYYRQKIFKKGRIHQLKGAGALIAAEIDRLIRLEKNG